MWPLMSRGCITLMWMHCICRMALMWMQGTDVDACYDNAYWTNILANYTSSRGSVYDSTYDVRFWSILVRSQVQALLADMCGWRMVAKRGYIGALTNATKTTLLVGICCCAPHNPTTWSAPGN